MKNKVIKKTMAASMTAMAILNANCISVQADWIKSDIGSWNWVEEGVKAADGWKNIQEEWYYFGTDGSMKTGWINDADNWYYCNESGVMQRGWVSSNDQWYFMDEHGAMKKGWVTDNEHWYYLNENGQMVKGWVQEGNKWYFMDEHGMMMTGEVTIEGVEYDFGKNGAWINNDTETVEESEEQVNNISQAVENVTLRTAYVITESSTLNVRTEPSLSGSIVGRLNKGTEITVIGESKDGFYPIKSGDLQGWASTDWISFDKNDIPADVVVETEAVNTSNNEAVASKFNFSPRTSAPSTNDIHYYSDMNIFYKVRLSPPFYSGNKKILGNCTWYAWGRAWELTGKQPNDAGFVGNAYQWWEANKTKGKFKYGSQPKIGAIAVWNSSLPGSEGCGHVAIVESIENGKVYISESAWHGGLFKYREIYNTDNLMGYIYLDEPNF